VFPALDAGSDDRALRVIDEALTYAELRAAALALAGELPPGERIAVWAEPSLEACVAVVAGLIAGAAVVPINPTAGSRELEHLVSDSEPRLLLHRPGPRLHEALARVRALPVDLAQRATGALPAEPDPASPALVVYTSGTTGPPKGAVLPRRAVASNLDALAGVWEWTAADRVVHALPLFHVHGLVLGVLGPLRRGGSVHHTGRFAPQAAAAALAAGGTMLFGVPTMYHRLAAEAEADPGIAGPLGAARLLVSGSAALPAVDHDRIRRATGASVVERYGMTETLMNTSARIGDERPGYVGRPLPGVELRLRGDAGELIDPRDDETFGELEVRGPNLFLGYLNLPDATAEAVHDGWFRTGDLATRTPDGTLRLVGRRSTDLIKSAGYRIGAGEIEAALLQHSGVAEAAVTGEPDADLGERIVAWVVVRQGASPSPSELSRHVGGLLASHKRPREVRFVEQLPRNAMGKVQKRELRRAEAAPRPDPPG
jgi:malonyl-CoA/methylmalonyl-CoA synthetase